MGYFKEVKTIQELKKQYRDLIMRYHPDLNKQDTTSIMQEINAEYDRLFAKVKNQFVNSQGNVYEKENTEDINDFKSIINRIITFKDCKIEIIGNWVWISGNTKHYREILKSLKFKWISNKHAWAYHKEKYLKKTNNVYTLEDLRNYFKTVDIETKEVKKIV